MAKITIVISDEINEGVAGVRYAMDLQRGDESPELARFPATPAMLTALTVKRLIDAGTINTLIGVLCKEIMEAAGLSASQQAIAEKRGFAAAAAEGAVAAAEVLEEADRAPS
jgi:hypothetical protein